MAKLGETLKQQRETRGVSLREISDATKIAVRYLEAIEQDHFDVLPGGVFNKGFIRAYAACVGVDEQRAVDDYLALVESHHPDDSPAAPAASPPHSAALPGPSPRLGESDATLRGPVAGIRFELPDAGADTGVANAPRSTALTRLLWVVVATILLMGALLTWRYLSDAADGPTRPDETVGLIGPGAGDDVAADHPGTPPATLAGIGGGPAGPFQNGSAFEVDGPAAQNRVGRHQPKAMNLEIRVHKKTWVRVVCDEHELVNRRMRANETQTMTCLDRIRISANDVSAIELTINGNACGAIGRPGSRVYGYVIRNDDHMVLCPTSEGDLDAGR